MFEIKNIKINKDQLEVIVNNYNIGRLINFSLIKEGLANKLLRLKTSKGKFIFKIVIRNNPVKVKYEIDLLNHIKNLPTPKLLANKQGKFLDSYDKNKVLIYPYLEGRRQHKFNRKELIQVGSFLAALHQQTENFKSSVKRTEFYNINSKKFKEIIKQSQKLRDEKIIKELRYIENILFTFQLPKDLPAGAMHIDLKPENTLFLKGKLTGVVDFDNSYNGPLLLDLANTIMWFCSQKGKFNVKSARIIYRSYVAKRRLNKLEKNNFVRALNYAFLSHTLIDIHYLALDKLPRKYILWVIDNLLQTQKNLRLKII